MALNNTTLASALAASDTSIVVASATGFSAGNLIRIDQEMFRIASSYTSGVIVPVIRAQAGTYVQAHPSGALVRQGAASDTEWGGTGPQTVVSYPIAGRVRSVASYSAAGAIAHPEVGTDAVAFINGTSGLAMTLAAPVSAIDGSLLFIIANGKAAHTVTVDGTNGIGLAGSSYDVATLTASGVTGMVLMAINGAWVLLSPMTGTLTNCVPALG